MFKVTPNGTLSTLTTLASFPGTRVRIVPWPDWFRGATAISMERQIGAARTYGTVFKVSSAGGDLTTLVSFNRQDGCEPEAGVIQGCGRQFLWNDIQWWHRVRQILGQCIHDDAQWDAHHAGLLHRGQWVESSSRTGSGQRWQFLWNNISGWRLRPRHGVSDRLRGPTVWAEVRAQQDRAVRDGVGL